MFSVEIGHNLFNMFNAVEQTETETGTVANWLKLTD